MDELVYNKPRCMMHYARKILVQQSLYIRHSFQVALLDDDGAPRKLLSLSATKRFL